MRHDCNNREAEAQQNAAALRTFRLALEVEKEHAKLYRQLLPGLKPGSNDASIRWPEGTALPPPIGELMNNPGYGAWLS